MTATRRKILQALGEMSDRYPEWRVGQMVTNVSVWARGASASAIWEVEDEEFLAALEKHLSGSQPE